MITLINRNDFFDWLNQLSYSSHPVKGWYLRVKWEIKQCRSMNEMSDFAVTFHLHINGKWEDHIILIKRGRQTGSLKPYIEKYIDESIYQLTTFP